VRFPIPARRGAEFVEAMDAGHGTAAEVADAYRRLDAVNRLQGGYRLTRRALDLAFPTVHPPPRAPLLALDVAGGNGRFAREIVRWGAGHGHPVHAVVVERHPAALSAVASLDGPVHAVEGDATRLPLADRSLDIAHCSCFFHHLSTAAARDLLADLCRVSRTTVVVNDLVRSWVAAGSIRAVTGLWGNRLVAHDGPLSVLKSFRREELLSIAHAVGTTAAPGWRWRILRAFPYRMALLGVRVRGS